MRSGHEIRTIINTAWKHLAKKIKNQEGKRNNLPLDGWSFVSMNRDYEPRASESGEERVTLSNFFGGELLKVTWKFIGDSHSKVCV